jgi:hypothetical protein
MDLPVDSRHQGRPRARRKARGFRSGLSGVELTLPADRSRILSAGGAALLMLAISVSALSPSYYVNRASVMGNRRVEAGTIFAASGIAGRHAFHIDPEAAAIRIARMPEIESARLNVTLPSRVDISIQEVPLLFVWQRGASRVAVDGQGNWVEMDLVGAMEDLPTLIDEDALDQTPFAALPSERVEAALAFFEAFGSPLIYRSEHGFVHSSLRGWEVLLGRDASDATAQARKLAAFYRHLDASHVGAKVEFLDLRFDPWYFRLREDAP